MTSLLTALIAAEQAATPAPFTIDPHLLAIVGGDGHVVVELLRATDPADAALIALARNALPHLLAVARAAEKLGAWLDVDAHSDDCSWHTHRAQHIPAPPPCDCGNAALRDALAPLLGEAL